MTVIWVSFKKELALPSLIQIDNIWAPLVVASVTFLCNKNRDWLINRVKILFLPFAISLLSVDIVFLLNGRYILSNYILQTATDITLMNTYWYAYSGFEGKVFDKADTMTKFNQWLSPFTTLAVVIGGCLGLAFSNFSLRQLITIQLVLDVIWCAFEWKLLNIGSRILKEGRRL
jgi:hypothetical protein